MERSSQYQTIAISIGGHRLQVEVADTPAKRQIGLMNRSSMLENHGMLFVFPRADYKTFWMKNTYIPLSIAFLTTEKKIVDLHDMKPNQTTELYPSSEKVIYALEVNQGWFRKHNIQKNDRMVLPRELKGI
ncbi:MAG: DUF192 domain-containing protein [Spirochaetota bacterium]